MKLIVAAVQMSSTPDAEENLALLDAALEQAEAAGASMAVLPENLLCMGRKDTDKWEWADTAPDWSWRDRVLARGRARHLGLVAGSLYCREAAEADPRVRARCWVTGPEGGVQGHYDKRHLFDVEAAAGESYRESRSIAPGSNAPVVTTAAGVRWGLSICYDLRFAEHYRALADRGAQVLTVPAAFTRTTGAAHWEVLLRARAIENQCFVVAADQCGTHASGRQTFGHSMIIDPWGRVLAQAGDEPAVITASLDMDELQELRKRFPVYQHRRTDGYTIDEPS